MSQQTAIKIKMREKGGKISHMIIKERIFFPASNCNRQKIPFRVIYANFHAINFSCAVWWQLHMSQIIIESKKCLKIYFRFHSTCCKFSSYAKGREGGQKTKSFICKCKMWFEFLIFVFLSLKILFWYARRIFRRDVFGGKIYANLFREKVGDKNFIELWKSFWMEMRGK
jgi:hypothetical protein